MRELATRRTPPNTQQWVTKDDKQTAARRTGEGGEVKRGFFCVGVDSPKDINNFGGIMRAAHVYGAALIVLARDRYKFSATNTTKAEKHIPFQRVGDIFDAVPHDCVPVAVDLIDGAESLVDFKHPERAFYIFGPEDGTLGSEITARCKHVVYIPTAYCMNLAATVNVVLYDRLAKQSGKSVVLKRIAA